MSDYLRKMSPLSVSSSAHSSFIDCHTHTKQASKQLAGAVQCTVCSDTCQRRRVFGLSSQHCKGVPAVACNLQSLQRNK